MCLLVHPTSEKLALLGVAPGRKIKLSERSDSSSVSSGRYLFTIIVSLVVNPKGLSLIAFCARNLDLWCI